MPKCNYLKNYTSSISSIQSLSLMTESMYRCCRLSLLSILCGLSLSGLLACGQKGSLYIADTQQSTTVQAPIQAKQKHLLQNKGVNDSSLNKSSLNDSMQHGK